jgi:hypothetical protein
VTLPIAAHVWNQFSSVSLFLSHPAGYLSFSSLVGFTTQVRSKTGTLGQAPKSADYHLDQPLNNTAGHDQWRPLQTNEKRR